MRKRQSGSPSSRDEKELGYPVQSEGSTSDSGSARERRNERMSSLPPLELPGQAQGRGRAPANGAAHYRTNQIDTPTPSGARMMSKGSSYASSFSDSPPMRKQRSLEFISVDSGDREVPRCVVLPQARLRQAMDLATAVALLYIFVVVPFRACFGVPATGFFFVLETCIDVLFLFDMFLNFRTAVYVKGELVTNPRSIARIYLKSWFILDLISVFPFDYIFLLANGESLAGSSERNALRLSKLVRLVRLMRMIRLLRLFRLSRIYRRWKAEMKINSSWFRLFRLAIFMLLLAHHLACLWFLVAAMQPEGTNTWVRHAGLEDELVIEQYTAAFYCIVMTISTVGYGDIVAESFYERVYITVAMLVGVTAFSYAIGSMSYLVSRVANAGNSLQDRLDQVNQYLKYRNVPKHLQVAIREHYLFSWKRTQLIFAERDIMEELSKELKIQMAEHLRKEWMNNNPLFDGCSADFLVSIIQHLQPQTAAPGDFIIRQGELAREMYILTRGSVDVCSADGEVVYTTLREGQFFGEIGLFTENASRTASVVAANHCELAVLSRDDFQACLMLHPAEVARLKNSTISTATKRLKKLRQEMQKQADTEKDANVAVSVNGEPFVMTPEEAAEINATRVNVDVKHIFSKKDSSADFFNPPSPRERESPPTQPVRRLSSIKEMLGKARPRQSSTEVKKDAREYSSDLLLPNQPPAFDHKPGRYGRRRSASLEDGPLRRMLARAGRAKDKDGAAPGGPQVRVFVCPAGQQDKARPVYLAVPVRRSHLEKAARQRLALRGHLVATTIVAGPARVRATVDDDEDLAYVDENDLLEVEFSTSRPSDDAYDALRGSFASSLGADLRHQRSHSVASSFDISAYLDDMRTSDGSGEVVRAPPLPPYPSSAPAAPAVVSDQEDE